MADSPALDTLKDVADRGNRQRRQMVLLFRLMLVTVFLSLVSVVGVSVLVLQGRAEQARQRRNAPLGVQVIEDLYRITTDTNETVHRIEGSPAPPRVTPPTATTTTTTSSTVRAAGVPPTTGPVARTPDATTETTEHPSSTTTAPQQRSEPPPATDPPTTARPCVTVPLVGSQVCP